MLHKIWPWCFLVSALCISNDSIQDNWNSESVIFVEGTDEWNNERVKRESNPDEPNVSLEHDSGSGSGSGVGPIDDDEDSIIPFTTLTQPDPTIAVEDIAARGNDSLIRLSDNEVDSPSLLSNFSQKPETPNETIFLQTSTEKLDSDNETKEIEQTLTENSDNMTIELKNLAETDKDKERLDFGGMQLPPVILDPFMETNETMRIELIQPVIENDTSFSSLRFLLTGSVDPLELFNNTDSSEGEENESNGTSINSTTPHLGLDIFLFCLLCLILLLILLFCFYIFVQESRNKNNEKVKSKPTLVTYVPNCQNEEIHFAPNPSNTIQRNNFILSNESTKRNSIARIEWLQNVFQLPITDENESNSVMDTKHEKYNTMPFNTTTAHEEQPNRGNLDLSVTKRSESLEDILKSGTMKLNGNESKPLTFLQKYGVTSYNKGMENLEKNCAIASVHSNNLNRRSNSYSECEDDDLEGYVENYQEI